MRRPKVHSMRTQANDLRDGRLSELRADLALVEPGSPGAVAAQREIAALTEQIDTLEKNARTLGRARAPTSRPSGRTRTTGAAAATRTKWCRGLRWSAI